MTIHLAHRDVTLAVVSRAPYAEIAAFQKRMGWKFHWVSSYGTDFNYDYHVSFTQQERDSGKVYYNYADQQFPSEEGPGLSVFQRDPDGRIYHTYSSYGRGLDILVGTYNMLDLVPRGRDEGLSTRRPGLATMTNTRAAISSMPTAAIRAADEKRALMLLQRPVVQMKRRFKEGCHHWHPSPGHE